MRCNAHCDFCDYWKTDPAEKAREVKSFADAARFFNPLMITFTGGEPLLRRDLEELVAGVARAVRLKYITVITHGAMLTPERAKSLWDAGINQFNISLDFLDERHDAARGIPGLTRKIFDTIPRLQAQGIDSIRFNTVIKRENLDQLVPLAHRARALGVGVSFGASIAGLAIDANGSRGGYLVVVVAALAVLGATAAALGTLRSATSELTFVDEPVSVPRAVGPTAGDAL